VRIKFNKVKELTVGSFVNFPLAELENYEKEYYGEHMNSLRKIKTKYDPYNVFKFPQVIKREK
ncbi:FAD-linked oxidase, partial [Clostridium perfringens]